MPKSSAKTEIHEKFVTRKYSGYQLFTFVILILFVFIVLIVARQQGLFQFAELVAYDQLVSSSTQVSDYSSPIALVEISERDIQDLGQWPLTDNTLANLLKRLIAHDPAVIGVDIYRDFAIPPGTADFQKLLQHNNNIIFVEKFNAGEGVGISPPEILLGTDQFGFSDLVVDQSGVVRRNLLLQGNEDRVSYSFALRMTLHYLGKKGIFLRASEQNPNYMQLGEVTLIPLGPSDGGYSNVDTGGYQILLDYIGGYTPFPSYTLDDIHSERFSPDLLKNKIVIVGVSSEGVKDTFITPHSYWEGEIASVSGITVHAHALNQLLHAAMAARQPMTAWSDVGEIAWIFLWILLGGAAGFLSYAAIRFAAVSLFGILVVTAIAKQMFSVGVWIPLVPPMVGWLLAVALIAAFRANIQRTERKELMMLLSKQVSPEVAKEIWRRRNEVLEAGRIKPQLLQSTVMFTDLQGFTQVSDRLPPKEFMNWLNSYMLSMSELIMRFGGVVDDYAGDGIKANFGVPLPRQTESEFSIDAQNAVECSLGMAEELGRLNQRWFEQGLPNVGIRIGIHTGPVVVGTLGSADRMKFTSVGRTVNLAARLESTKQIPINPDMGKTSACRILISDSTAHYLPTGYDLVAAGEMELRGLSDKVRVFLVQNSSKVE